MKGLALWLGAAYRECSHLYANVGTVSTIPGNRMESDSTVYVGEGLELKSGRLNFHIGLPLRAQANGMVAPSCLVEYAIPLWHLDAD